MDPPAGRATMDAAITVESPEPQRHDACSPSDVELIAALNDGEAEAFDTLYHRHRTWVADLALRFTGDHGLALDVLQETFLYLLGKFPGFRLTASLRTFLYPAIRHIALTARRKAARLQDDPEAWNILEQSAAPGPVAFAEEPLAAALASLSADHREVLLLRFVDGFSLAEIAQATAVPLGTVKSRLHHALAALRADPRTRTFFTG